MATEKLPAKGGESDSSSFRLLFYAGSLLAAIGIVVGGLEFDAALATVDESLAAARSGTPTRLRGASLRLTTKSLAPPGGLAETLKAMGYEQRSGAASPGQFFVPRAGWLRVSPHRSFLPGAKDPSTVDIRISGRRIVEIRNQKGRSLAAFVFPSAEFSRLQSPGGSIRRYVPIDRLPKLLRSTIVAVEDQRFFEHRGVDAQGILRAFLRNMSAGRVEQGGSTITQQLAKNLFLRHDRTFRRKLDELFLAMALERRWTKEQILERYINEVYLGQRGSFAISGLPEAAHAFFSRGVDELSVPEIAMLVGLIPAPNAYAPDRHVERATERRDLVLEIMRANQLIDEATFQKARKSGLNLRLAPFERRTAPFYVDQVTRELENVVDGDALYDGGFEVETSIDLRVQQLAESALSEGVAKLEAEARVPLDGAIVVLEAQSGRALAIVGGRDFGTSQFNRAVTARRPIGSLVKPLLVLAMLEENKDAVSPRMEVIDEPFSMNTPQGMYRPKNIDGKFRGRVTLRYALEHSLNVPFVRLAQDLGVDVLRKHLRHLGLTVPNGAGLSQALGAVEASPLEVASAYQAVANYGLMYSPHSVERVVDADGQLVFEKTGRTVRIASPQSAFMVAHLMRGVVEHGTGAGVRALGYRHELAGKTGTSDDTKDAWFVGFDRELVIVVWVGSDQPQAIGRTGSRAALPIFVRLMQAIRRQDAPPQSFVPAGLEEVALCRESGHRAGKECPSTVPEIFFSSALPSDECELHQPSGWINDLFKNINIP